MLWPLATTKIVTKTKFSYHKHDNRIWLAASYYYHFHFGELIGIYTQIIF